MTPQDAPAGPVLGNVRYLAHRARQAALRKVAHAMPPTLKYRATLDLVAGVAPDDAHSVSAMDAIGRYAEHQRLES